MLIRGLAIYFVWAHPYIDFDGVLVPNLGMSVALVVLAVLGTAVFRVFLMFHGFFVGLALAAALAIVWWRLSPRR